jgi:hypothetical protein
MILPDRQALLDYLELPLEKAITRFGVKSIWMCELIEKMFAETGKRFAYNADIKIRAEIELGLSRTDPHTEGTPLSTIIYNAQEFVRDDYRIKCGYEYFTQAIVDEAGEKGKNIQFQDGKIAKVKKFNDRWYALPKGARKRAYSPNQESWVKMV